jgi:hypothetical protein
MKKILLSLVLSSLIAPLTAQAAAIEISSVPAGTIGVTNGSSNFSATGSHTGLSGNFSDEWNIVNPAGAFLSLATSTGFSAFNILYSTDNGSNWLAYSPTQNGSSYSVGPVQLGGFSAASPLRVILMVAQVLLV